MKPKTLHQLRTLINFEFTVDKSVSGYSVDSRTIQAGEVYVALKGEKVDGHEFIGDAKAKGASAAIVAKSYKGLSHGLDLIYVDDPLVALQELARQVITQWHPRIVAVTGSVGKTTTKDFITTFLRTRYRVASSPGNSNSQVGIPLAILNHTQGDEDIVVLEMGMTLPGHIRSLISIAPPEVSVITTIALVHACSFSSLEEIAHTKAEIFSHPATKLGIIPYEMPDREAIKKVGYCKKVTFSVHSDEANYYLKSGPENTVFDGIENRSVNLGPIKVMGSHNRHNILAAAAVARYFDIPWGAIAQSINSLQLPDKRLQIVEKNKILFINDSYNAAEVSVKAALDSLPSPKGKGRRIAVLGSMMELGKFSDECHRKVGEHALNIVDRVYCFGVECKPIYELWKGKNKPAALFLDRNEMIDLLRNELQPDDVVLLKGSRSKQLWKVLEEI